MYEPTPKSRVIFQIKENMVKKYSFYSFSSEKRQKTTFLALER